MLRNIFLRLRQNYFIIAAGKQSVLSDFFNARTLRKIFYKNFSIGYSIGVALDQLGDQFRSVFFCGIYFVIVVFMRFLAVGKSVQKLFYKLLLIFRCRLDFFFRRINRDGFPRSNIFYKIASFYRSAFFQISACDNYSRH